MVSNGWNVDIDYSNGNDSLGSGIDCLSNTFYGYNTDYRSGIVSATFRGSGTGVLSYENCFKFGYILVLLNGVEMGSCYGTYDRYGRTGRCEVTVRYRNGDVLNIESSYKGIMQLHIFVLHHCRKQPFFSCISKYSL